MAVSRACLRVGTKTMTGLGANCPAIRTAHV